MGRENEVECRSLPAVMNGVNDSSLMPRGEGGGRGGSSFFTFSKVNMV